MIIYLLIAALGFVLAALSFVAANDDISLAWPKLSASLFTGVFAGGLIGFFLTIFSVSPPAVAIVATAVTLIAAIVAACLGIIKVKTGVMKVFYPGLVPDRPDLFNIESCHMATPGLNMVWTEDNYPVGLESFVTNIPMGRIILDGAENMTDPPKAGPGIVEVLFSDGSVGFIPYRIEGTPLYSDRGAMGRFITLGTRSGHNLDNHDERLEVVYDHWSTSMTGPLERVAYSMLPSEVSKEKVQAALDASNGTAQLLEDSWNIGLAPWPVSREIPNGILVRVGDIQFSEGAKKTLSDRAKNKQIADTAAEIHQRMNVQSLEQEGKDLLGEQKCKLASAERDPLVDLAAEKVKLLAKQKKAAARKKAILSAQKEGMPDPAAYAASLEKKGNTVKIASDYRAEYAKIVFDLAEATEAENATELEGDLLVEFQAVERTAKEKKSAVEELKSACRDGILTGEFHERYEAHRALVTKSYTTAYKMAQAGEDADLFTIDVSGGDTLKGASLQSLMEIIETRMSGRTSEKKGGEK